MVAKDERRKRSRFSFLYLCGIALVALLAPAEKALAGGNPPYPGTQPTKVADCATVAPGGTINWTVTILNDGASDAATIFFTDDVPDPADGLPVQPWSTADIVAKPAGSTATYNNDSL